MKYRYTFLVEFPDGFVPPVVSCDMEILGGKCVAVAFGDEMTYLEELEDRCDGEMRQAARVAAKGRDTQ
jgi:hypothetical protein